MVLLGIEKKRTLSNMKPALKPMEIVRIDSITYPYWHTWVRLWDIDSLRTEKTIFKIHYISLGKVNKVIKEKPDTLYKLNK
jgi:hypothetical protein